MQPNGNLIIPAPKKSLEDIWKTGLGLLSWNGDPSTHQAGASTPTSQTIYAVGVPYRAGMVITNLMWYVTVAAAGTTPTGIFCGLANATTVVMDSANLASSSAWTSTGFRPVGLSSQYTVPTDGIYYHLVLFNGTFGTTQPTLARQTGSQAQPNSAGYLYALGGTGQTTLPAVNAAITLTSAGAPLYFSAFSN